MRFLFSFLLTGMLFINSYSQNSFFSSSSAFKINNWCQSGPCGISSYHFTYDTILNGQFYHRFDDWGSIPGHVYLRESNDSVFCYGPTCNSDLLLYNFGLQVGDTFLLYNGGFPCTYPEWFVADTVSTVTLMTGLTVPYIHLSNGYRDLRWMYHVGDVNYGFFEFSGTEWFDQFICASDNSGLLWRSNYASVAALCDSLTTISESKMEIKAATIFPNPSASLVTIKWDRELNYSHFILISFIGQTVSSFDVMGNEINLDISEMADGLYFYSLNEKDEKYNSGKFIVKKEK